MIWTKRETQLNDVLATLVYRQEGIAMIAQQSGISPSKINFSGNADEIWHDTIIQALRRGKLTDLIEAALRQFPDDPYLLAAKLNADVDYTTQPDLNDKNGWKEFDEANLEVLTTGKSTLLPISFLETGIRRSSAVAKVEITTRDFVSSGTGFLFQVQEIDGTFFMTNHHVISDKNEIKNTKVIFNFELDENGNTKASESFSVDVEGVWFTSPTNELDVTVFQLDKSARIEKYGYLDLIPVDIPEFEFVNIIQHPGGMWKQISLYHNVVTTSTDRVVQYLTDTLKGSSGAPVFNSSWEVVAIHHSGGNKKGNENLLPVGFKSRNEGIRINKIIEFFKAQFPYYG
ncbi:V8-like Glu-specific endopeptidase [Algoriphagus locisalis]|uniref:Serine protease n=1 Tax=Algoriphagus locisalis TaxID=305507 RepID=A0A1I7CAM4_9BACT|nr:trypsin-like peptidase domain-containing protein [Algoriphagus locisalis]SFT96453.1 V8-like Glu-specific endopeptidase [Algoriphagus locisalis]